MGGRRRGKIKRKVREGERCGAVRYYYYTALLEMGI